MLKVAGLPEDAPMTQPDVLMPPHDLLEGLLLLVGAHLAEVLHGESLDSDSKRLRTLRWTSSHFAMTFRPSPGAL